MIKTRINLISFFIALTLMLTINAVKAAPVTITQLTPPTGSTNVDIGSNLTIKFNQNVALSSGNLRIYEFTGCSTTLYEVINVYSGALTGDTVIFNPVKNFRVGFSYFVKLDAGAITQLGVPANTFAGINDSNTWTFSLSAITDSCYDWRVNPWQTCVGTVHAGCDDTGTQTRTLDCIDVQTNVVVSDSNCDGLPAPITERPCVAKHGCDFNWVDIYEDPGLASVVNKDKKHCTELCSVLGKTSTTSADGFMCASGEVRPPSAELSLFYRFGIWGSGEAPPTHTALDENVVRCYRDGQKPDDDRTDKLVGCYCN